MSTASPLHSRPALAIINPKAGKGAALRLWRQREADLKHALPGLTAVFTERTGHATQLARAALRSGVQLIVSVGGDGTNNEVLSGFIDAEGVNAFPEAELALLPGGRGCDFTRTFGKPSFEQWLLRLKEPARAIDYGVVQWGAAKAVRAFLNLASLGASCSVLNYANSARGWLGSELTYLVASVRAIINHKNQSTWVRYEDEPARRLDLTILCVANGQYFGAGIWVNPAGRVDDGAFDVIEVCTKTRWELIRVLAKAHFGKHLSSGFAHVVHRHCRTLSVWSDDRNNVPSFETDGEVVAAIPAEFRIAPAGIRVRGL